MIEDQPSSTHPPLPPTSEDQRFLWLRLLRSRRVGPATFHRLLREHGSAGAALDALPEIARQAGVSDYKICPEAVVHKELALARATGAQMVAIGSAAYPVRLAAISDAPPLFWAIGDLAELTKPLVAIVGARNASALGTRVAQDFAQGLGAKGYGVVSGLARGVDRSAHLGALEHGTIAVQAGGVDVLYPAQNADLFEQIGKRGLRISEDPMGMAPSARHFPKRNRIISGLSRATVVVEAAVKSGSLITARTALDQGREVLAVPGHPYDARAAGCNLLIRDGAHLVRNVADILEVLDAGSERVPAQPKAVTPVKTPRASTKAALTQARDLHSLILDRLSTTPMPMDVLARDLPSDKSAVAQALTDLEMNGQIARQSGGLLART